tara:strand:+ start:251 stop:748 length:498 start_codon:yes stop_codon:yes gene_type:complete
MKLVNFTYFGLFLILILFFSSCGYELRSFSQNLSNQVIDYQAKDSQLNQKLKDQLALRNNTTALNNNEADLWLEIISHSVKKFVGAVGAGARTTQVRLDYELVYKIGKNIDNSKLYTFKESSFIDFDQSDLLAFERESDVVIENLITKGLRNMEFMLSTQSNEIK